MQLRLRTKVFVLSARPFNSHPFSPHLLWLYAITNSNQDQPHQTHQPQGKTMLMIRPFKDTDLDTIMQLWLDTNIQAHNFVPPEYWHSNFELVKSLLPQTEVYVYQDMATKQIAGFIGLSDHYIAGIFVRKSAQSQGIGKQLLDHAKSLKTHLSLNVYQQNIRAIRFYQREQFTIQSASFDQATQQKEYIMVWRQDTP